MKTELSEDQEKKFSELTEKAEKIKAERDVLLDQEKDYEREIEESRESVLVKKKAEELYKTLLDKYVHRYAESFKEIVTEGLESIFYDQDLAFDVVVDQKHGKVWVEFETVKDGHRGQSLEAFGGGVSSVESLLLRILVLLKKDLARYLILDESLASLSQEYIENAGEFMRKMCDEMDVDILLITHNRDFLDHVDNAYEADLDQEGELVLEKSD